MVLPTEAIYRNRRRARLEGLQHQQPTSDEVGLRKVVRGYFKARS
jgi:hypothetical protein